MLRTGCWYWKGRAFAKGVSRKGREEVASAVLPGDEGWPLEAGGSSAVDSRSIRKGDPVYPVRLNREWEREQVTPRSGAQTVDDGNSREPGR